MTTVMILAAGMGNRLRPYTDKYPKCLVPLLGKTIIERQLSILKQAGIKDIIVVGGYKAEKLVRLGLNIVINKQYETTNMVATLFKARENMTTGADLIISYGDIVYEADVLKKLLLCDSDICLVSDLGWKSYWKLRYTNPLDDIETFKINREGFVIELGKKPQSLRGIQGQFTGLFKFSAKRAAELAIIYDSMDKNDVYDGKDFKNMYMTSFLQHLIKIGWKIKPVSINHGWLEIDTVEDLDLYNRLKDEGRINDFCKLS